MEVISDRNEILNIKKELVGREKNNKDGHGNTIRRNIPGKSDMEYSIIDLPTHPEEIEKSKYRFALRYRHIGASGIEINSGNGDQSEEFELEEIVYDSQLGDAKVGPDDNRIREKETQLRHPIDDPNQVH